MSKRTYAQLDELGTTLRELRAAIVHIEAEVSTLYPDNDREPATYSQIIGAARHLTLYVNAVRVAVATLPKGA
jgi:hypothetical protein